MPENWIFMKIRSYENFPLYGICFKMHVQSNYSQGLTQKIIYCLCSWLINTAKLCIKTYLCFSLCQFLGICIPAQLVTVTQKLLKLDQAKCPCLILILAFSMMPWSSMPRSFVSHFLLRWTPAFSLTQGRQYLSMHVFTSFKFRQCG